MLHPAVLLAAATATSTSAPVVEEIVVTAARMPRPVARVPDTVVVIPRAEIARSPSLTTDGLLRAVPSAATFRRTHSLVSDPTAQGLNLRGLAPSGVSRALVLLDGVPVNDPFGGWVYWRALPRLGLERIEIAPSGGSALYGSAALGGVVQLVSRPIEASAVELEAAGGRFATVSARAYAAGRAGDAGVALEGEVLSSDGHPVVAEAQRGPIDGDAASKSGTLDGRAQIALSGDVDLGLRLGFFREVQSGGTTFTTADVDVLSYATTLRIHDAVALSLFGHVQRFHQSRARVAQGRASESLAAEQRVPSDDQGASIVWNDTFGMHALAAGADLRRVAGFAEERVFGATTFTRHTGGEQQVLGVFAEDLLTLHPAFEASLALRADVWRNLDGRARRQGAAIANGVAFDERVEAEVSPKLALMWRPSDLLVLRASAYRAFRAPALNELYRPFQVGTVLTAANEALAPERVLGAELGVETTLRGVLTARVTGFWNELDDPIVNATLATPRLDGAQRQRQNLGHARVRGLEASAELHLAPGLVALLAYTLADSEVTESPDLEGKRLPQDPVHRGTATLAYDDPAIVTASLTARFVGPAFEDDQNQLEMDGFVVLDASVARDLFQGLSVFATVENLTGAEYLVGRAGVDTVGQPLLFMIGVRYAE